MKYILIVSVLALLIIHMWWMTPTYIYNQTGYTAQSAGEYGELFGATNSLFSGLALLGILVTFVYQGIQTKAILDQVKVMARTFDFEKNRVRKSAMPIFENVNSDKLPRSATICELRLRIRNVGATVTDLSIENDGDFNITIDKNEVFKSQDEGTIEFLDLDQKPFSNVHYTIRFKNYLGEVNELKCVLLKTERSFKLADNNPNFPIP